MAKVIAYTRLDGGISVIVPAPGWDIDKVFAKDVPSDVIDAEIVEDTDLPTDRYFRNAWSKLGKSVFVDMVKARGIHMKNIRLERDKKLKELDPQWMKALGQKKNAEADQIEAKRQALRDLPQIFDLTQAQTPEELKAMWPVELS